MKTVSFSFKKANRYILHIVFIGLGIGTANYILNGGLNWVQWSIQSVSTSFLIGYTLVVIGLNKSWFKHYLKSKWKLYIIIFLAFFLIGALATEIEHIIRSLVFHSQRFHPLSSGKMYLFNGIISLLLGFGFFINEKSKFVEHQSDLDNQKTKDYEPIDAVDPITNIPVKQGENIFLIPIGEVVYFEAFDNYSFVYDFKGEKKLCDYSLLFLEKRLDKNFSRVHRKYIVNVNHIKQVKPHLNGRFVILFHISKLSSITSSKSYAAVIRKLIKIE